MLDFNLEIINSDSSKLLVTILQKVTYVTLKHKKVIFNWFYESGEEDILEIGEYMAEGLDVPFNFIRIT